MAAMKKLLSVFTVLALIPGMLAGCDSVPEVTESVPPSVVQTGEELFSERDKVADYREEDCVRISFSGNSASASSNSVILSGSTVTLTEEATYLLSGTLEDGMILVDAPEDAKLRLILDGVSITNSASAPLYIRQADKVFVTLAEGSENTLENGGVFTEMDGNSIDGAVFSKQDLTFNGSGSLTVISPAGHGIVCKDDLVFTGGTYTLNTASHALDANDSVRITGDTVMTVHAGKDGIHCEHSEDASLGFLYISGGTLRLEAEGDGISASAWLEITGGAFDLLTGGGSVNGSKTSSDHFGGFMGGRPGPMRPGGFGNTLSQEDGTSMKGIKAAGSIRITGGSFRIDSADDGVHSDTSVTVAGGTFEIASGDDAFHGEETLTVTAGTVNISESYEGLEALHVDIQGGDIRLVASDDGLNAAGGTDSSGTGGRDGMFGGPGGGPGGRPGGMGPQPSGGNGSIQVSGGTLSVTASGDGMDANGTLEISGGHITVEGPTQGDTATLDYDTSAVITGGTFIGTGAYGMAQTFSGSEQGVIALSVGNQQAGTEITVKDSHGNTILSHTPSLSFAVVILSSPSMVSGETYTITVGEASGEFAAS